MVEFLPCPLRHDQYVTGYEDLRTYLDGMRDLVGEVLHGTYRRLLLRGVLGRCVRLGQVWHNNLCVTLGAESARLEEGLLVEDAALVHVQTRFHVVQCICHAINAGEEVGIINVYMNTS